MFKTASRPLPDLKDWRFSVDEWGLAWAEFDREGENQNSLGRRPLEELGEIVAVVEKGARDKTIRGLVIISAKERGFIVGAPVANALGTGIALVRKPGKLPWSTHVAHYDLEYGSDTLEIHYDALAGQRRVLIVSRLRLITSSKAGAGRQSCASCIQASAETPNGTGNTTASRAAGPLSCAASAITWRTTEAKTGASYGRSGR